MPDATVSFKTFGCKQNQYDTDFLRERFEAKGFRVVESGPSDVVVVNTCAVTSKAAAKCRQAVRAASREGAKVVVTGCYAQVAKDELRDLPGVIAVAGVRGRAALADLVERALSSGEKIVDVQPHAAPGVPSPTECEPFEETPVRSPALTRAFLKIQEGCGDYCAYCIVPFARGPSRSRRLESILEEAKALVQRGYKEIVLTGTHIGLYGKEASGFPPLSRVVREVSLVPGILRLRVSSLEPHDVDEDLLDVLRLPQVCHHLHLPLQSGSDRVLRSMGRRYTAESFLETVERARRIRPDAGITTDVIAGFPGETDRDFEDTLLVLRKAAFSRIHAFKFSSRPGTRACAMPGKMPDKVKEERVARLVALGRELSLEFHRKHVGRSVEVLVEEDRAGNGLLTGVTRNYIRCYFEGEDDVKGRVVSATVKEALESSVLCSL